MVAIVASVMLVGELTVAAPTSARAEVQKVLFVCAHGRQKQICPQLRASTRAPDGWVEDRTAESKQGHVIYVPKGKAFDTAPAAITVTTTPNKSKMSIEAIAQREQDVLRDEHKDVTVAPLSAIANEKFAAPAKVVKIIAPDLKPRGYEIVARFPDRDAEGALFTVEVTLSAMTERGLMELRPKLDAMVKGY
jgi:hypothetical protein